MTELLSKEELIKLKQQRTPLYTRSSKVPKEDRHKLVQRYIVDGISTRELAKEYDVSQSYIHQIIKKFLS